MNSLIHQLVAWVLLDPFSLVHLYRAVFLQRLTFSILSRMLTTLISPRRPLCANSSALLPLLDLFSHLASSVLKVALAAEAER
ncbi:hypothetical protein Ancab_009007, partial [Ancistrocladus abbreviatus]